MSDLSDLLARPPGSLVVDTALGEITIKTAMTSGPGKPWQEWAGVAGLLLLLGTTLPGAVASWVMTEEAFQALTAPLCAALLLSGVGFVLSGLGRSGGPLVIRGNTLVATRYPVQLDQIRGVTIRSDKIRKSTRYRYSLVLRVGQEKVSWSMPNASGQQAAWVGMVVEAAAAEARQRAGTATEIPAALSAMRAEERP